VTKDGHVVLNPSAVRHSDGNSDGPRLTYAVYEVIRHIYGFETLTQVHARLIEDKHGNIVLLSSKQERQPPEAEGSDIDQLADRMLIPGLSERFSDITKPFMARLDRSYMGLARGTTVLIKSETPKQFGVQHEGGTLEEDIPKFYLQWDEDRCAVWRLRSNDGEKEEDLTTMPTAGERAAYVTPEARTNSSIEPNPRKRASATEQLGRSPSITPDLSDFAPSFLQSSREGKPVQQTPLRRTLNILNELV
jgi:hypothetical protein